MLRMSVQNEVLVGGHQVYADFVTPQCPDSGGEEVGLSPTLG